MEIFSLLKQMILIKTGEAEFVNDIPAVQNQLYAAVVLTRTGPGLLDNIDTSLIKVYTLVY